MIASLKRNNKKTDGFGLIGILMVIAIVALVGGGGLYLRETQKQKTVQQIGIEKLKEAEALKQKIEEQEKQAQEMLDSKKPTPSVPQNTTATINTSNWKTYRNEKYGFEVKYPHGWEASPNGTAVTIFNPANSHPEDEFISPDIIIGVRENLTMTPIDNFISSLSDGWYVRNYDLSELTVDGHRAMLASSLRGQVPATPALAVFVAISDSVVIISGNESSQREFFEIIKSLNIL